MKIRYLFLACLLAILPCQVRSQSKQGDKFTLLTVPYNNRPLNVYRGQLMINAGYEIAIRSKSFDVNGDVINLRENGSSSVLHDYFFSLRYGVLDFLEIGLEDNYKSRAIRTEAITYASFMGSITYNTLKEYTGMGDLFLYGSLRLPFEYKTFDLSLMGGLSLPTAAYKSSHPEHTITDYINQDTYTVNYHYINKNGNGVPFWQVKGSGKFLYSKFAAEASFSYTVPFREGNGTRWDHTLTGKVFTYTGTSFLYLPDETAEASFGIFYQANGWFNVHAVADYKKFLNGWTEYYGIKYRNPDVRLLTMVPGYEIQVSPAVRISQLAGFSLSGRNSDAPFFMVTTLTYNLMPFSK